MRRRRIAVAAALLGAVVVVTLAAVAKVMSDKSTREAAYRRVFSGRTTDTVGCHYLIYIDVEACLACTEDMSSWVELERNLPGGGRSPHDDAAQFIRGGDTSYRVLVGS